MKIYFNNNGCYGQDAVYRPVLVEDVPIGFIYEVTKEQVTCYIWDKFINVESVGLNITKAEQNILSIGITFNRGSNNV